jgi:mono/diheme cytochrome c family protein
MPGDEERGGRLAFEPRQGNIHRTVLIVIGLVVVVLVLAACGSSGEEIVDTTSTPVLAPSTTRTPGPPVGTDLTTPLPAGDAATGEQVYKLGAGCAGCHSLAEGVRIVPGPGAPSFFGIAERAGTTREGYSAEEYLRESIVLPCEFLAAEQVVCQMPRNFGERLDAQEVADLIAFLMTQSG